MIKKSTWILFLVMAILVFTSVLVEKNPTTIGALPSTPSLTPKPKLFKAWDDNQVTKILVDIEDKIVLEKGDDKVWRMQDYSNIPVDQGAVAELFSQVSALKVLLDVSQGVNPQELGLDFFSKRIIFQFENGLQTMLLIGDLTPTSQGYYVQVDNSNPAVVGKEAIDVILNIVSINYLQEAKETPEALEAPIP